MEKPVVSGVGAVSAALGSMLCCTGPLVAASLGMSGAALAVFVPYRPLFVFLSAGLLWYAFRELDRTAESTGGGACNVASGPRGRRVRAIVWTMAVISTIMLTSPLWDDFVFRP
ncbi:MAG: mercuric transporter MerT family protein [Gemmatimonadota bacterium]